MTLSAGSRLGPYEILALLGAGGMGEVYRARDTRLGREIALKVLPAELAEDRGRLKRFEREALAASALSHPNIVTIYEIGSLDSTSYIAMERVEGATLRDLLVGGALPVRKLLQTAAQIAAGLARAHASGIVHRDLKPENVMVTKDGIVKILDFGLAKLTQPEADSGDSSRQTQTATSPGMAVGTAAYMSPEQASGEAVDFRSDQFAFGSMLYEMATGRSAFLKKTGVDTLAAILNDDPEPVGAVNPLVPGPVRWIVERCLAKEPSDRYASTEDLAREVAALRDHAAELSSGSGVPIEPPHPKPRRRAALLSVLALAALAGTYLLGRRVQLAQTSTPRFRQLTFRGAGISTARFTPDGQSVVFSSETEGRPPELYAARLDSPEVRSLGLPPAHVLSISGKGLMAILLLRPYALTPRIEHIGVEWSDRDYSLLAGTLAEVPLAGGAPRELLEDALFADWAPDGTEMAVVRRAGNHFQLESPIGTPVFEQEAVLLNHPRFAARGNRLVFKDWGRLLLREDQRVRILPVRGEELAWSNLTNEIWYKARGDEIRAVTPGGRDRLVTTLSGDFVLYDISADGRVLLGRVATSSEIFASFPGESRERNLSYFDLSSAAGLTPAGDALLFTDQSGAAGGSIYFRKTDGSPPKRLGRVSGYAVLSRDGTRLLSTEGSAPDAYHIVVPVGPGEVKRVNTQGIDYVDPEFGRTASLPDGQTIVFAGFQPGKDRRVWAQSLAGGKPRALTPEGTSRPVVLGEGEFVCARGPDFQWRLYPVAGGEPLLLPGLLPGEEPFLSTPDGQWLYIRGADELRAGESLMVTRIYRLDPRTGRRELWKEIPAREPRAGGYNSGFYFSADGKTCVWTHMRYSTELVLAEGLK